MKNRLIKSLVAVLTVLSVFFTTISPIAATAKTAATLEGELIYYYEQGDAYKTDVLRTMAELKAVDATAAAMYQKILDEWDYIDNKMVENVVDVTDTENLKSVPSGLPMTATHAFVLLGYALNADGTLQDEAIGRCKVAYMCAKAYPNAKIYATGGGTAKQNANVTEAGQMKAYLVSLGLDASRIIMEDTAKNTAQNAQNTFDLMIANKVKTFSIISSQYHLKRGCLLFYAESLLKAASNNEDPIELVGNAGWLRSDKSTEGLMMEGMSLGQVMGVNVPGMARPGETAVTPKQSVLDGITAAGTTSYKYGAKLNLKVSASYTNEDYVDATSNPTGAVDYKRDVTSLATITGFDPKTAGTQTLTITYTEGDVIKTITMDVTVAAKVPDTGDAQIGYLAGWSALMAAVAAAIVVLKRRKAVEY